MSLRTPVSIAIICFVCHIATGCHGTAANSKKVACPAFESKELTAWLPYKDNEKLIFHSTLNTYDTFTLKNIETSAAYEAIRDDFDGSDACNAYQTFQSAELDSGATSRLFIQLHTQTPFGSDDTSKNANINLDGNTIDLTDLKNDGFAEIKINNRKTTLQYATKATIHNKTFPNVQTAIRDTVNDKSPGIYQVYISKGNGIVAYRNGSITWTKQ